MLLATLREPPEPGSLRESVLLLLIIQKDRIEHAATKLLTQSQVNAEAAPKAFEEYVKIRYPYLETAKKREKEATVNTLLSEIRKGPLVISPMGTPAMRSRMQSKVQDRQEDSATNSRLMHKIGRSVPV